jgi:hypothetical protein
MVNGKYWIIFNGVFEKQKSTLIEQKNAKMRAIPTSDVHIYHARVKHDWLPMRKNLSLTRKVVAKRRPAQPAETRREEHRPALASGRRHTRLCVRPTRPESSTYFCRKSPVSGARRSEYPVR